jgi:hypothetical protein
MTTPSPAAPPDPAAKPQAAQADPAVQPDGSGRRAESMRAGINAAAQHPGSTSARSEQVREARRSFANAQFVTADKMGDSVGTQFNTHYHGTKASTDETKTVLLSDDNVIHHCETFIKPVGFTKLTASAKSVMVLRGPHGAGKFATALSLLRSTHGLTKIYRLSQHTDLAKFTVDAKSGARGYVLEDLSSAAAGKITGFDLERLAAECGRAGARLIITVRPELVFTDNAVSTYVAEMGERPHPREVTLRHLRRRLSTADDLLRRPDVQKLLDDLLTADAHLSEAARLAEVIADESGRPDTLADSVRQRVARFNESDFAAWFDGLDGTYLQCFAIALAIFNRLPYESVADTAAALHRKFDVAGSATVATRAVPEAASPFGDGRSTRLQKLRARVSAEVVESLYGTVPAEIVRYVHPAFPGLVLQHVWREHDRARPGVLAWLRDLGDHQNQMIRIRAAAAVGVLTAIAYDHVRYEVLTRWATSTRVTEREAAAIALDGAADGTDPSLQRAVAELIEHWSYEGPELRATAARAYGTRIGLRSLSSTLQALERLSADDENDFEVWEAVCYSLTDLVESGDTSTITSVLVVVNQWATGRREHRRMVAAMAFLLMSADLLVCRSGRSGVTTWPTLLWLAYSHREQHQLVARLWAAVLNSGYWAESALTVFRVWAEQAEGDEVARAALVGLSRSAGISPRVPARLRKEAQRWLRPGSDVKAKATARDLLANLPEGGL